MDTSGYLVLHYYYCFILTSGFYLWQFQVFNSSAEGLVVDIVLIGPVTDFIFAHTGVWTRHLWISSPTLYQCTTATSGFHLWQFQVFKSGAEEIGGGIVLIGTFERFSFLPSTGVWTRGLWISSPCTLPLCHSATSGFYLWQLQVFNSGAVSLKWWQYCSHWTCDRFSFLPTLGFELGTSGYLVLHSTNVPHGNFWFSPLTISGI